MILLLQYEPKSLTAGISAEACGFVKVKIGDSRNGCECLLGSAECFLDVQEPHEVVFVLISGCKGASRLARAAVDAENWLARPQNVRRWLMCCSGSLS